MADTYIGTTQNDISQRRTDESHLLKNFKGVPAQLVVDVNDFYRIAVMDGQTLGGVAHTAMLENAPFKKHPTVPSVDDISKLADDHLTSKQEVNLLVANALGGDFSQETPSILEQLHNKLDRTQETEADNFNSLVTDGFYYINNGLNAPMVGPCLVHVQEAQNQASIIQTCFVDVDPVRVFVRRRLTLEGAWSSWFEGLLLEDINTVVLTDKQNIFAQDNVFQANVEVQGVLSGPTIDSKFDHTVEETECLNLNDLTKEGYYYFQNAGTVNERPTLDDLEFFVHVYEEGGTMFQLFFSMAGHFYYRCKTNQSTWTQWIKVSQVDKATTEIYGTVKLTSVISDAEDLAITPKAVNEVKQMAIVAQEHADANELTITNLDVKLEDALQKMAKFLAQKYVKTVENIVPDVNGNVTLHRASEVEAGIVPLATPDEVSQGTEDSKAVTPLGLYRVLPEIVHLELLKIFSGGDGGSGSTGKEVIEAVANTIANNQDFLEKLHTSLEIEDLARLDGCTFRGSVYLPDWENTDLIPDGGAVNKKQIIELIKKHSSKIVKIENITSVPSKPEGNEIFIF